MCGMVPQLRFAVGAMLRRFGVYVVLFAALLSAGSAQDNQIYEYAEPHTVETLAGPKGKRSKAATDKNLNRPRLIAVDKKGNTYVADETFAVRKISPSGAVSILAGSRTESGYVNGVGKAARFGKITGLAVDKAGNVYVAEAFHASIRKITPKGKVSTFWRRKKNDKGIRDFYPEKLAVDSLGNVYVGEDNVIYKFTTKGKRSVFAGKRKSFDLKDGKGSKARFQSVGALAFDSADNLYVLDEKVVRKISPSRVVTTLEQPSLKQMFAGGIAVDNKGDMYLASDLANALHKVTPAGRVSRLNNGIYGFRDGARTNAYFARPADVAWGPKGLYIADTGNDAVRILKTSDKVTTLAAPVRRGSVDAKGTSARFRYPSGIALGKSGLLYVADYGNSRVRTIDAKGVVKTLSIPHEGKMKPSGVAMGGDGTLYIADGGGHTVRKWTTKGKLVLLAGSPGKKGSADGNGSAARFSHPRGIAVDANGNVYVADAGNRAVRKITPAGKVTTIPVPKNKNVWPAEDAVPLSVAVVKNGSLFVATERSGLAEFSSSGKFRRYYTTVHSREPANDENAIIGLNGTLAVATGPKNTLYVTTVFGKLSRVKKDGKYLYGRVVAGGAAEPVEGLAWKAGFRTPTSVAVDSKGTAYVVDQMSSAVRVVKPAAPVHLEPVAVVNKGEAFKRALGFWGEQSASVTGQLPTGVSFIDGSLEGTLDTEGEYKVNVSAKNKVGTTSAVLTIRVNLPPEVSKIADQVIPKNGSAKVTFTLKDDYTAASDLRVDVYADGSAALLPTGNLKLSGTGSKRTLTITPVPKKTGKTSIVMIVSDGWAETRLSFNVRVK